MQIALFFVIAITLLIIVSGGYTFWTACFRGKERSWLESDQLKGTSYEKYDKLIHNSDDWLKLNGVQDVFTDSKDGLKLCGLWVPAANAKGTVILAHGYRSTMLIDFGKVLDVYHNLGLNLLLPYQRAHGKSEGRFITFGVKESDDMLCWIDFHNRNFGNYQIILSGLSMGASTMMFVADKELPKNVKGIIVDCGFTSPAAIISKVFRRTTHLPAAASVFVADLFARLFAGFSLFERDSRKTLSKNALPIIMVHGKADDFVPFEMTVEGYKACSSDKDMLIVDNAGHGLSYLYAENEYRELVVEFLRKNIEGF